MPKSTTRGKQETNEAEPAKAKRRRKDNASGQAQRQEHSSEDDEEETVYVVVELPAGEASTLQGESACEISVRPRYIAEFA